MTHAELLAALEAAEGPSRKLDAAIWRLLDLTEQEEAHCRMWCRMDGRTDLTRDNFISSWAKDYTSSIDAGRSLLLPGWEVIINTADKSVQVLAKLGPDDVYDVLAEEEAKTVENAFCIAALRARGVE